MFDLAGWQKGEGGCAAQLTVNSDLHDGFKDSSNKCSEGREICTLRTHQVSLLGPKRSDGLALAPRIQDSHVRVDSESRH